MNNDIYKMKLHDYITISTDPKINILRVPNGWIYRTVTTSTGGISVSSTFVPYSKDGTGFFNDILDTNGDYIEE